MTNRRASHWIALILGFLLSQGVVQLISLAAGLLILRLLSVQEYAIFTIGTVIQSVAALASDLGLSQGVVSHGSRLAGNRLVLGSLYASALRLRRRLFWIVLPLICVLSVYLMGGNESRIGISFGVTAFALAAVWLQQPATIGIAILNIHHDSAHQVRAGLAAAVSRVLLAATLCVAAPYALTAIAINTIGVAVYARMVRKSSLAYGDSMAKVDRTQLAELKSFVVPLVPGVIYYLIQGQVGLLLLSLQGATASIAEVGALGRLGQIVALIAMLNGFFFQPYFARIQSPLVFAKRASQVFGLAILGCIAISATTIVFPNSWLLVLGANYHGLQNELVIAILGAELSVIGGLAYTIVIATGSTRGQWWQIAAGISAQVLFIGYLGVRNTHDALVLTALPAATFVIVQLALLTVILRTRMRTHERNAAD